LRLRRFRVKRKPDQVDNLDQAENLWDQAENMGSIEKEYNLSLSAPMVDWPSACVQGGRVGRCLILSNNPQGCYKPLRVILEAFLRLR